MKKIKLLTPLMGLTALSGALIPLTSCACSTNKVIPTEQLNIVGETLKGLKDGTDVSKFDTLVIPSTVHEIDASAFANVFANGSSVKTVIFHSQMRLVKANAFKGCNSITNIDFSNWNEETITYCVFEENAFANVGIFGKITYPNNITAKNKEILEAKLKTAGLNPTWFTEETTGHISCSEKEITSEKRSDVFTFALTEELTEGQEIVCLSQTTSATQGVSLTVDENVAVTAKSAVLTASINNVSETGDYVGFDTAFICYKDSAHKNIAWIEGVRGLKYTFKFAPTTLDRLEVEIETGKEPTLERASLKAANVTVKAIYIKHEQEIEEVLECGGENGYTVTNTVNGIETDITSKFATGFIFNELGTNTLTFKFGEKTSSKVLTIAERTEPTCLKNNYWSFKNVDGEIHYFWYGDVHGTTNPVYIQEINPDTGEKIGDKQYIQRADFNAEVRIGSDITATPNNFLQNCTSFNSKIVFGSKVQTISKYFLTGCKAFNQPIEIPNTITKIGEYFMYQCEAYTHEMTIPESVTILETSFMRDCLSFNHDLYLPQSLDLTKDTGTNGLNDLLVTSSSTTTPAFASTIYVGKYTATQLDGTYSYLKNWFGNNSNTIRIAGDDKANVVTVIKTGVGHPNVIEAE